MSVAADETPMSCEQVSRRTGVPSATLRYWRAIGEGPRSYRLGRRVVYDVRDVEAWIAAQKESTGSGGAPRPVAAGR